MTILVTGATGGLGSRVVTRLLSEGRHVRVLTRRPFAADRSFGTTVEMVEWHPYSEALPMAALANVDQVIHLMGPPYAAHLGIRQLATAHQARLHVTQRVVGALADRRIRLVVASLAVPPAVSSQPNASVTETTADDAPAPGLATNVRAIEQIALDARTRGLNVAVLRLGLLTSPSPIWTRLVGLAERGLVPPLAGSIIPAIDPEDAATLLTGLLARSDLDGVFHGVAPVPLTGGNVLELLRGVQQTPMSMAVPLLLAQRLLGATAPILFGACALSPTRLTDAGARFAHPDLLFRVADLVGAIAQQRRDARAWNVWSRRSAPTAHPTPEPTDNKVDGEPSAT